MVNKTAVILGKKLREIYDSKDFVAGVLAFASNEEDQQAILEFIKNGDDVDDETVTVLAIELNRRRKNRERF